MSNFRDFTGKNRRFKGNRGINIPTGAESGRGNETGELRFNTDTSLAEYFDGSNYKSIDSPPTISSISPTTVKTGGFTLTITGSNFASGASTKFVGDDGTEYNAQSTSFTNSNELVATGPATALTATNEPYDVVVTNPSGLAATLSDALDAGDLPSFDDAAGTNYNIFDSQSSAVSFTVGASDVDSTAVTWALTPGSTLPGTLTINSSTGEVTGTVPGVATDTTSAFSVDISSGGDTVSRAFNVVQKAPVTQTFTSSGTFTVPSGVTSLAALVVAGGGGGGGGGMSTYHGGSGGGGGGFVYQTAIPVTPGATISITVGNGGSGGGGNPGSATMNAGQNGQDSVVSTVTASGGGYGGASGGGDGGQGGTGGGTRGSTRATGSQGGQGGLAQGQGGHGGDPYGAGGGGGGPSGQTGGDNGNVFVGVGGNGTANPLSGTSVTYAGGGGGGDANSGGQHATSGGSQGGSGGGGKGGQNPGQSGQNGTANRGGGGGGGHGGPGNTYSGGSGGSGIVIISI